MSYVKKLSFMLVVSSTFASCSYSTPQNQAGIGYYKVGNPYKINDQWYTPQEEPDYKEQGMASWYGPNFHGKKTANGDIYNQYALTAAHRTLPLPSMVRVTNLENNRSINVMVNDRGPFAKNRIIDVSKRVAEILGFKQQGTAKVNVTFLREETAQLLSKTPGADMAYIEHLHNPTTQQQAEEANLATNEEEITDTASKSFAQYIQAGTFSILDNATQVKRELEEIGSIEIASIKRDRQNFHRVKLGPYEQSEEIQTALQKVISKGFTNAIIIKD